MKITKINHFKNVYKYKPFDNNEKSFLTYLPEILLVVIFALVLCFSSLFFSSHKYYEVDQFSMQPLLNNYGTDSDTKDGVFVLADSKVEVGDIIVINYKDSTIIKRLIATGGDRIAIAKKNTSTGVEYVVQRIAKGSVTPYVLVEPYLQKGLGMADTYTNFKNYLEQTANKETINGVTYIVLEEDEIFYLGDNRGKSYDSSNYGPGKFEDIVGKVKVIVWKQQNMLFHIIQYVFGFREV
jgi:signal peptidase I